MSESMINAMYLGHSGFLIDHPDVTMIFDWSQGRLPEIRTDKPLCVFISHVHSDHFNPEILNVVAAHPKAEIYLGYDHSIPEIDEMLEKHKISFLDGEQKIISNICKQGMIISTYRSTDLGVALLVEIGRRKFFHAGDLYLMQTFDRNLFSIMPREHIKQIFGTYLDSYDEYLNLSVKEFNEFTEPLKGMTIDYGMIPLDPRVSGVGYETVRRYMELAEIKSWSPMHLWGKYGFVDAFLSEHPEYSENVIAVTGNKNVKRQISVGDWYPLFDAGDPVMAAIDESRNPDTENEKEKSTWGPPRAIYEWNKPADHVTFNSMRNNPKIGDERNFVRIRKYAQGEKFSDSVDLEVGKEYEVGIWFDNNSDPIYNSKDKGGAAVAENVRLRIEQPNVLRGGKCAAIKGIVSSTTAEPEEVWDIAYAHSPSTVLMRYVVNSAVIHSQGSANGKILVSEALFGEKGAFLAYWDDLWGTLPAGSEYSGYVTYRFVVDQAGFRISSGVAFAETGEYVKKIIARPGDTLELFLDYRNTGTINQLSIIAYDSFPKGIEYIEGSSILELNGVSNCVSDRIIGKGINLGDYRPGDYIRIKYKVKVLDDLETFPKGDTCVYNDAKIATANGTGYVKVAIIVHRE